MTAGERSGRRRRETGPAWLHLLSVALLVVAAEPVLAEIVAGNAQDGVNVVCVRARGGIERLHILVLDEQCRAVNPVVDGLIRLRRTHPGKMELVKAGALDGASVIARHRGRDVAEILVNQRLEQIALPALKRRYSGRRL